MSYTEEKQFIIDKIISVENHDVLAKIISILEDNGSALTLEQQNEVRERREAYLRNPNELISENEFMDSIRLKYGF